MSTKYYFEACNPSPGEGTIRNPFSSLESLKDIKPGTGDEILLKCGSVFRGEYIHLHDTDGVTISSYGTGPRPVIDASGSGVWFEDYGWPLDNPCHRYYSDVSSTVLLFDCNDIRIENIEVRNSDSDIYRWYDGLRMPRTGIAVAAQNRGTVTGTTIENVFVRDVRGNIYDKHLSNGGIYFTALRPDEGNPLIPRFDNVRISGCFIKSVSRWGIAVGYTYLWKKFAGTETTEEVFGKYGNTNVRIDNCYVKEAGGDAITVMYALRPVVSYCRSDGAGEEMNDLLYSEPLERKGKVAAAIWPWKCLDALFEYNEVYDTRLNQDGMAYDADSGWGTVYRHNYSHANEGGAVMFCLGEAIGSVYERNVSDDDLGGVLSPSGCPDGIVSNNRIYRRKSTPLLRRRMSDGKIILSDNEETIIERKR